MSIKRRLSAMKTLHDEGIRTTCFISPIFPEITDVEAIIDRVKEQCNLVWLENMNLRGSYKAVILDYIREQSWIYMTTWHQDCLNLSMGTCNYGIFLWAGQRVSQSPMNYFYHEEVKKSAKKGRKSDA